MANHSTRHDSLKGQQLYVSANNAAMDFIKLELDLLQRQNKSLTQNSKNLAGERDLCRHSECSLGNLITDAMVAAMNGDSTWSSNYTRIGIFPAVYLQPEATIPKGTYAKKNVLYYKSVTNSVLEFVFLKDSY